MHVLQIDCRQPNHAEKFCQSLQETGFAVLENHPISPELIQSVYLEWRDFFNSNIKQDYLYNKKTQDGFFPITVSEKAKGAEVKDIKEYFQYYPWGQYPKNFSENTHKLYQELNQLAETLLAWIAKSLPDTIQNRLSMPLPEMISKSQQTMLRILHYPPLSGLDSSNAVRAAAHEDINLITLLVGATDSGLQVLDNHNKWHEVPCSDKSLVVNIGDMLALATGYYFKSTTHRVINPSNHNSDRLSIPLFLHPRPEVLLAKEKTAADYLHERLTELGVL